MMLAAIGFRAPLTGLYASESIARRCGVTQTSTAAAATSTGTATATVTKVAASSSSQAPRRDASVQAASGRNSAVSSGSACGSRPSRSTSGEVPSCAETSAARCPSAYAWVASENTVAAITKLIASGPARSWTRRHTPLWPFATIGSDDPAMNPATHASACSASTSPLR